MTEQQMTFQAEVSRLLDIVAHSLYSEKEIFLRELISNASDACDRLRYAALTDSSLLGDDTTLGIRLLVDKENGTLAVADNGIGMNKDDLITNLGTIARSGTGEFLKQLGGDAQSRMGLIGQFGVGFYSAFMVADRVDVYSRKAGETEGWHWSSDGKGTFTVADAPGLDRGSKVVLHLKDEQKEYLEEYRLSSVVRKYSDHISFPVWFGSDSAAKTLNTASALWMRAKAEVTPEQYKEFYHHVAHAFDEPWVTAHWRAEGKIEYAALIFVPSTKPFDLFDPRRSHRVKLYVRRVFITDQAEGLVPPYLRFLRGVVDSEDLPLNVSREMLQNNPVVAKIKAGLTRRVLSELQRKAEDAEGAEAFATFWENFGAVIKEGLYEDSEHRDDLLKLVRFRSTAGPDLVSLEDYAGRMKDGQDSIFFITGDKLDSLRRSPQLEGFAARGLEVLLLTDPVDEFWIPVVHGYKGKSFKSVTRSNVDLQKLKPVEEPEMPAEATETSIDSLIALLKLSLKDAVKDVRSSDRLTESPVCLVSDEGDMDMHLERLLKQHRQLEGETAKRILEVNARHPLIKQMADHAKAAGADDFLETLAWLLLDQARIVEGETVPDPAAFARRLTRVLTRDVGA